MEKKDIIRAVMEKEYQISPEAVELIHSSNSPEGLLKYVLSTVNTSVIVIGTEHIDLEGFAASGKTSKLIYTGNGGNPGFKTSAEASPLDKIHGPSPEEREFLSRASIISSRSGNLSSEPDSILVSNPPSDPALSSESDPILVSNPPSDPALSLEHDAFISAPDPIIKPSQGPVPDSISVPDIVPDMTYEPAPNALDTQSGNVLSEEVSTSDLASNSLSSVKVEPSTFSSHSSKAVNRSASSFFGQGNSLPSSPSNRIFRTESTSSVSGNGLFSGSKAMNINITRAEIL